MPAVSRRLTLPLLFVALAACAPHDAERALAAADPAPAGGGAGEPRSFRFAAPSPSKVVAAPAPPFSLTAADGTGLALVDLEVHAVVEPPLAFTELTLTFDNPRDRTIEGRFRIALPPGAALSRFAMELDGRWQEGEVVERQRARQIYEDFLHRRQDPALLENEAGNEFSARVFPIPARGRKRLVVSYSHQLERAAEPYVVPLAGLPEVANLGIRVLLDERRSNQRQDDERASNLGGAVSERRVLTLHKEHWTPDADFVVDLTPERDRLGLRHDNLVVARVAPDLGANAADEVRGLYILVDTSASRALGYAATAARVSDLVSGLAAGAGPTTPLAVATFDQTAATLYAGTAVGFGGRERNRLATVRPLGASDLEGALRWLAARLAKDHRYPRVLLVSDGIATAGRTDGADLRAAVASLAAAGVERLDLLAPAGQRDQASLRELVVGNLPRDGVVLDGAAPLSELARRLATIARSGLEVAVDGATWVWPQRLDGVQPGDEVLIWADLPAALPFRLRLGGQPVDTGDRPLLAAERPLLERAWVQARIGRLLHLASGDLAKDPDLRRAMATEATKLSVEHRVLCSSTAFLVLETAADYERYNLPRNALADILTVGAGGLEVLARSRQATPTTAARPVPKPVPTPATAATASNGAMEEDATVGNAFDELAKRDDEESTDSFEAITEDEPLTDGSVRFGVEGGVVGGVVGGVAGGVAGGVITGVPSPEPVAIPEGVPDGVAGGVPGRLSDDRAAAPTPASVPPPPPPPPPPPSPRRQEAAPGVVAETISVPPSEQQQQNRREANPPGLAGPYAEVDRLLTAGRVAEALAAADRWQSGAPGDTLALVALGRAAARAGQTALAARAYGSLIDLYPSRADLRRTAGEWLETLPEDGLDLAIDTYQKAVVDRPDHLSGHRLLAWALWRAGRLEEAFATLERGLAQPVPGGRYAEVGRVMREDLALLGAAWAAREPARRNEIRDRLRAVQADLDEAPSLRFVLTWETDANDVDLHVTDRHGNHAYYSEPVLRSGGQLYADVTTGYGPECFNIPRPAERRAYPYRLQANYYSRGPMGYGMGTLHVLEHDGHGHLQLETRPFVVMVDGTFVELGTVTPGGKKP
jgi:tetratricopeptide (TPR) repeat protein